MHKPLVSVIVPSYNAENHIGRLLDSLLAQTYEHVEIIIVNDGSTDSTKQIVMFYEKKFLERGFQFIYIEQENKGLGGAINTGLKHFHGEYLIWPDADDYLSADSIEKRVNFLEFNPEFGIVSSDAAIYDELDLNKCIGRITIKDPNYENRFEL